ncbi:MAG TPA: carboxypeptidase-like regulatory domain-containing protein, partial [Pyrinomonadaceae bacterium]|nr:carboxypeptidase-like regulatory domain-containing protein [Pyrinomonadaceae bacterium]
PVSVDPVAAYQFTFGVPTLNQNASLTFDILLANLDAATRQALLDAVAIGQATLATRGDAAGSMYQAFPVCASGVPPTVGGCVSVELLDANGQPTMGMATTARFSNVVGHFSTWAVAIVASPSAANVSVGGRVLTAEGAGIGKAKVSITDAEGNTKIALTNPFGYYRFDDVEVGPAYLVSVEAKRHQFENPIRTVHVVDELSDINFIALPQNIAEARVSNLFSFPSRYRASRR